MTATETLTDRIGQMLKGRYRLDQVLHAGTRSTVYAGVDVRSGRVAIKVLHAQADSSMLRRGYLANAVGHAGAVNVLDAGSTEDGAVFLVMELIEAMSMPELLKQEQDGCLPVRLACSIADQGLDLLASAHAQGIVHGELGLAKLFLTRCGQLKVLGFGQLETTSEQACADDVRDLTRVIASLLCGEETESLPSSGADRSKAGPELPRRIAGVLQRGLSRDPAQRWPSARAMRDALQLACLAELGRPVDRALQPLAANQQPRSSRAVWIAAAGALLVGVYVSGELHSSEETPVAQSAAGQLEEQAEAHAETDIAAATEPLARTKTNTQARDARDGQAVQSANQVIDQNNDQNNGQNNGQNLDTVSDTADMAGSARPTQRIVPRKPTVPELRMPTQRQARHPARPTDIGPANNLCAQLSAARSVRSLSSEESQAWLARCSEP